MMTRPIIGVTLDHEAGDQGHGGGYSRYPWYALRQNYADCVVACGGVPLALPHEPELVAQMVAGLDGLLVTGGNFDVDPALFGEAVQSDTVHTKDRRTRFEFAMVQAALARDLPVLGICGGQQLLNVVFGGPLIQHIPDSVAEALAHEQPNPRHEPGHTVTVEPGTLLDRLVGPGPHEVNSAHHQAVRAPGRDCMVNAWAPDGVIEGIEHPGYRFCLGVQWHPEFFIGTADRPLISAFIAAAAEGAPQ